MSYLTSYGDAIQQSLKNMIVTISAGKIPKGDEMELLCSESRAIKQNSAFQIFVGNGASAAFGSHMALDWSKNGKVRSISITDPQLLSAAANDLGVDNMFSGPISWLGKKGDLLVTISSSGDSPNILAAITAAREHGMRIVTLSGLRPDNRSRFLGDVNLYVPAKTYGIVECVHQILLHAWLDQFMGICEWDRRVEQNMRFESYVP